MILYNKVTIKGTEKSKQEKFKKTLNRFKPVQDIKKALNTTNTTKAVESPQANRALTKKDYVTTFPNFVNVLYKSQIV